MRVKLPGCRLLVVQNKRGNQAPEFWAYFPLKRGGVDQGVHSRCKDTASPSVHIRLWTWDFLEGPSKMSSKGAKVEEVRMRI